MDGLLASRTVRSLTAAVLALLACGVFAPGRLEAGCATFDHYFDTEHLGRSFSPLVVGDAYEASARHDSADPWDSGDRLPCSGPSCSRNPAPPFAPVVPEMWYFEHGLVSTRAMMVPPLDSRLRGLESSLDKPFSLPSGLFRPPR